MDLVEEYKKLVGQAPVGATVPYLEDILNRVDSPGAKYILARHYHFAANEVQVLRLENQELKAKLAELEALIAIEEKPKEETPDFEKSNKTLSKFLWKGRSESGKFGNRAGVCLFSPSGKLRINGFDLEDGYAGSKDGYSEHIYFARKFGEVRVQVLDSSGKAMKFKEGSIRRQPEEKFGPFSSWGLADGGYTAVISQADERAQMKE